MNKNSEPCSLCAHGFKSSKLEWRVFSVNISYKKLALFSNKQYTNCVVCGNDTRNFISEDCFMMIPGTNPRSPAPWDLPYWMPDYMIFFGALYLVLAVLGIGLACVLYKTWKDSKNPDAHH